MTRHHDGDTAMRGATDVPVLWPSVNSRDRWLSEVSQTPGRESVPCSVGCLRWAPQRAPQPVLTTSGSCTHVPRNGRDGPLVPSCPTPKSAIQQVEGLVPYYGRGGSSPPSDTSPPVSRSALELLPMPGRPYRVGVSHWWRIGSDTEHVMVSR